MRRRLRCWYRVLLLGGLLLQLVLHLLHLLVLLLLLLLVMLRLFLMMLLLLMLLLLLLLKVGKHLGGLRLVAAARHGHLVEVHHVLLARRRVGLLAVHHHVAVQLLHVVLHLLAVHVS